MKLTVNCKATVYKVTEKEFEDKNRMSGHLKNKIKFYTAIVEQNGDCATIGISETAKDSIALMQENPLVIEIDSESRKMKIVDVVGSAKKEPVPSSK